MGSYIGRQANEAGESAYVIAQSEGFTGTKQEWLDSLAVTNVTGTSESVQFQTGDSANGFTDLGSTINLQGVQGASIASITRSDDTVTVAYTGDNAPSSDTFTLDNAVVSDEQITEAKLRVANAPTIGYTLSSDTDTTKMKWIPPIADVTSTTGGKLTDAQAVKFEGIATGATNTSAPHYTSAIPDVTATTGGLVTDAQAVKFEGIATGATNTAVPTYTSAIPDVTATTGGLLTDTQAVKFNGIATGATNTSAPHYTSAIPNVTATTGGLLTDTQAVKFNGIATGATSNTGTVTSVVGGSGLSGGTITGSGTLAVTKGTATVLGGLKVKFTAGLLEISDTDDL